MTAKNKKTLEVMGVDTSSLKKEIINDVTNVDKTQYADRIAELKEVFYRKALGEIPTVTRRELRNESGDVTGIQVGKEFVDNLYEETVKPNLPCERALAGFMLLELTEESLNNNSTDTLSKEELEQSYIRKLEDRERQKREAKKRSMTNENIIDLDEDDMIIEER